MNTPQITPTPDAVKLAGELAERILPYTAVARADMVHEIDQLRADATAILLPVLTAQQAEHAAVVARLERERDALRRQCAVAGIGDHKGDYFEGRCTETGIMRQQLANLRESKASLETDLSAARAEVEKTNEYLASRKITEMFPGTFAALDDVAVRYVADLRAQLTALRKETQP